MDKISLDPYLFFQGNCKEAMEFYKSIFGGELTMQTVDDFPGDMPEKESMKGMIMHSRLEGGDIKLMGSDSPKASPTAAKVELSLSGTDEPKLRKYFEALSAGGKVKFPLKKEAWGDTFGMLTDKFGVDWMVNITTPK
jgi:PhnB protein